MKIKAVIINTSTTDYILKNYKRFMSIPAYSHNLDKFGSIVTHDYPHKPVREIVSHIIDYSYINQKGVVQRFYSRHGEAYHDWYSYFQGMNYLVFFDFGDGSLPRTIQDLIVSLKLGANIDIPVDKPRIGFVLTKTNPFAEKIKKSLYGDNIDVTNDLVNLFSEVNDFVDFEKSHGYNYRLADYIELLENVEKNLPKEISINYRKTIPKKQISKKKKKDNVLISIKNLFSRKKKK